MQQPVEHYRIFASVLRIIPTAPWVTLRMPLRLPAATFFLQRGHICDKQHKMKGNRWEDHYTRRARNEKWRARSVYKLQEIDKKFTLLRKGDCVLDLGCHPGSWSQYSIRKVGPKGRVVGIDVTRPERLPDINFRFIESNVLTLDIESLLQEVGFLDLVISDLAPPTTGIRATDSSRSMSLAQRAAEIALALLKEKGRFLCKVFEGEEVNPFKKELSAHFQSTRLFRPKATRKGSREVYLIGLGFEGRPPRR